MADKNKSNAINTHDKKDNIPHGMLSSPHIAYCVDKYKIIDGYNESCLGPATYHMRIGGNVLTWENGKKIEFTLEKHDDVNKNIRKKVDLKPNSLTFVTTREKFNLPKDIIARFNLKSKWIHKGLLLGTGPIVDPELKGNLLIPLHNFSSQDVTLEFNDELISVEFTKTLNPDDKFDESNGKFEYIPNKHWDFDFDKYREKIGRIRVESSVSSSFDMYEKAVTGYKDEIDKINEKFKKVFKKYNMIAGLTAGGTIIGLIVLVFTTWSLISNARDQLTEATNIVKVYSDENYDLSAYALKSKVEELQKKITKLEIQNREIYTDWMLRPGRRPETNKSIIEQK